MPSKVSGAIRTLSASAKSAGIAPLYLERDMKLRAFIAIAITAAAITNSAYAEKRMAFGAGLTCGGWTAAHERLDYRRMSAQEGHLLGYLSGANAMMNKGAPDPLVLLDADAAYAWVTNYCREHPLEMLGDAAASLFFEAMKRTGT